MANKMWFGIPGSHMQWVPCPSLDSAIQRNRYVERIQFENGGGDARRSAQYQMEYQFAFSGLAHEVEGIDAFNKFAQGFYGDDYIYLAHPANFETNMFSAVWASPGIIEQGWGNICSTIPSFLNTPTNTKKQPKRSVTWDVNVSVNSYFKKFTIPIPPTHTLNIGATYTYTGAAVVQVRPTLVDNTAASVVNLINIAVDSPTRMNHTFSGATYQSVDVYISRTDAIESTITITSMMAQLYETGRIVSLPSDHYQGEGSSGLMFVDDAIVENYSYMHPPRKGISTTLVEVEAWR